MDYITSKVRKTLTNEPYILSVSELRAMMRQNQYDVEETKYVTESTMRGESYYEDGRPGDGKLSDARLAFFKEVTYRDRKMDGYTVQYPHGRIIRQGARNSYYRGENQIYESSQPSLFRILDKLTEDEKKLYRFVSRMRIAEFQIFLNKLGIVRFWQANYGTVLYEPLAQHYGLETRWLDITSDLDVALFFATCKYDSGSKRWSPLTKADTEVNEKTKYGVIFHIPGWQAERFDMLSGLGDEYVRNEILPIGYQPFMRCHSQHGYGICMKKPFPLQEDRQFEKLYFRHDEKFSREIFEKMDCGRKIYPQEGLNQFDDIIEQIKHTTFFSREAFDIALTDEDCEFTEAEVQKLIDDRECCKSIFGDEIIITAEEPIKVSRQRIKACNMHYDGFSIEKNYGIKRSMRWVYIPPV